MKFKICAFAIAVFCVITLCSCSSTQIENTDILTTYFADESAGVVKLGGGVANVRTLADSMADKPVSLIYAHGKDFSQASERLKKSADHPLFFGGIRALVVGKELARNGIEELIESVKDNYKIRSESMFFVSMGNVENIVTHKAINDFTGGFAAESLLNSLAEEGEIFCVTLSDIFEMLSVGKTGIAVSCINVDADIMSFEDYAIFDGGKMIETTQGNVSKGINMFLNDKSSFDFYIDGQKYTVRKTAQKKEAFLNSEDLFFDIGFFFEGEFGKNEEVKNKIETYLSEYANSAFEETKTLGCDFLNLYRLYQKKYRYEFESAPYKEQIKRSNANIYVKLK